MTALAAVGVLFWWVFGMRVDQSPSVTTSAVKLYATEADANARKDDIATIPVGAKCYTVKVGGKANAIRVRCENPKLEGWVREFYFFDPPPL